MRPDPVTLQPVTCEPSPDRLHLVAHTERGDLLIPLRFKTRLLREVKNQVDEMDAFFAILDGIGEQALVDELDELDIADTTAIVAAWFGQVRDRLGAQSLGESSSSSK